MAEVKIHFSKASNYRLIPCSGAWGGITAQGLVVVDFYIERLDNPETIVVDLIKGQYPKEKSRSGEKVIRESQVGVVITPELAASIGNWLIEKSNQAKDLIRGESSDDIRQ